MKSWTQKHEGSVHRSEPPMIGDDMHINSDIHKRDDSQSVEKNINLPGNSASPKSTSLLDRNGDKNDEQKSVADLRTFYSSSSAPLIGGREISLSDPIEIYNGNFQSISTSSAACNSVRILPEFLVEHARSMSFSTTESINATLSNILSTGAHTERDSMHHAEQSSASSGNLSLPANSDLIYNSVLSSQYHSTSAQAPGLNNLPSFNKISWRKGKWIDEEGVYTKKLIEAFNAGLLKIPSGTTLRSFLAEQLSCDPMRITKKFARSSAIGKQVFVPCDLSKTDPKVLKEVQDELNELGEKFRSKVELAQSSSIFPINTHAALAAAMRGVQGRSAPPYYDGLPSEVLRNLVLAQQNQLIRNSLIHTGQIPPNADSSQQLSSHGLPDMTTLSSLYFGTTSRSAQNGASSSGPSSSSSVLQEDGRIKPELSSGCASLTERSETVLGKIDESANAICNDNMDPQSTIRNILHGDSAAKFLKRLSDHQSELAGQFIKPAAIPPTVAVPSSIKLERKPSSTTLNSSTVSLANISKSLYEAQLNESQSQAMNYNQTYGTGLSNMANFPYDLLYNQSAKYSAVSATEGKKLRKERAGGNPSEAAKTKVPSGSKRQPQLQPQVHTRKSDNDKTSSSSFSHTQQQQQQLLSQLQQEIFNNATKKSSVGDDKAKSKSTTSKKYNREQSSSSSSSSMHENVGSNKDQQVAHEEERNQQSGDLYASDLLMNFFKAANHSPMSGVQQVFSDSNQFHGENGDGDDYVNGQQHMRRDNSSSDTSMKNGMEKLPSNNNNNNNNASNGTCSDSGESNGNGHGAHKVNSNSHTTSESDSSTSTSGNEEHDQDRERKSSSSPSSMADETPRATAKDRSASNTDRSKRKLTAVPVSTGDMQETGSDHKSSDLTNNSHSISDEESTDSSTRFEIDASNSNSSNDLKSNHFDGNRIDAERSGAANEDSSSGDITGSGSSSNPTTTNNNTSNNSKKRSRTTFQRSEVEEDMLRVESDVYCTLDTLQSQGETIDSNARKKLVNRIHSSPTSKPAPKLLEAKSKSAYDNGPPSSVE